MNDFIQFLIPVTLSMIAIIFSGYQLYTSNKQYFFEKRLRIYLQYKILRSHQDDSKLYFDVDPCAEPCAYDMIISSLTNDSELSVMCDGWTTASPLLDSAHHKTFLSGIEKVRSFGEESEMCFGKYGTSLCLYFNTYADLLHQVYQYRIADKHRTTPMALERALKMQEPLHRELVQTYIKLCTISTSIDASNLKKFISFTRG